MIFCAAEQIGRKYAEAAKIARVSGGHRQGASVSGGRDRAVFQQIVGLPMHEARRLGLVTVGGIQQIAPNGSLSTSRRAVQAVIAAWSRWRGRSATQLWTLFALPHWLVVNPAILRLAVKTILRVIEASG